MREHTRTFPRLALALAGTAAAMGLWSAPAQGAGALWISAPNWSYSAAAAQAPVGFAYFWGLSVGVNSYSWAYAFANGGGGAAYAFATASAGGRGGRAAVQVAGFADPYAGVGINGFADPSDLSTTTETNSSDPFSLSSPSYTVSPTGITFNETEASSELSGDDELQAFVYNGGTDETSLDADLGDPSGGMGPSSSSSSSAGDVDTLSALQSDFGLTPLDAPMDDPSSITSIPFTENAGMIDGAMDNVILVGISDADSTPEPASLAVISLGSLAILQRRRRLA